MKTFKLKIFTPYSKYFDDEVTFLSVKSEKYSLGITQGHAPLISSVSICNMVIERDDQRFLYAISGGLINVKEDEVVLLTNSIEKEDEIDFERAIQAKQRAEERLNTASKDIDKNRAKLALLRAKNRLLINDNKKQ